MSFGVRRSKVENDRLLLDIVGRVQFQDKRIEWVYLYYYYCSVCFYHSQYESKRKIVAEQNN